MLPQNEHIVENHSRTGTGCMDSQFGKILIITGIIFVLVGIILLANIRIPFAGKLPGDLFFQGKNSSLFFPITTCIIISIILTVLLNLFRIWK